MQGQIPRVLALYGQLGSGKTTLIQGLAQGLGISDRLISPTFILERRYGIPATDRTFHHLDVYRLTETSSWESLGLAELFSDPQAIIAIEWADRVEQLPVPRIEIFARLDDGEGHTFTIAIKQQ